MLVYIVLTLVLAGCGYASSESMKRLDEAGRLMQSDPASALEHLNKYDVAEFEDSSVMARWALLYSEALVANRISAPTDTIVNIAIDYYSAHNEHDKAAHARSLKAILANSGQQDGLSTALYLQKEKEFMLYKERVRRQRLLWGALAIFLVAAGTILWLRQRLKAHELKNIGLMAEASNLRDSLKEQEACSNRLESKLTSSLATRFDTLDRLCQTYYESQGTKAERKAMIEKVRSLIEELRSDSGLFAEMEQCVNDCRSNMLARLKEESPELKPDELRLFVYLASNLSHRTIALLLDENIDVVYKRKSRLKAKVNALSTPEKERFMSVF